MERLDTEWDQVRYLWQMFDPIGVRPEGEPSEEDWPYDEYDAYVTPTLDLLRKNASHPVLVEYITWVCHEAMSMEHSEEFIDGFVMELERWKEKKR